MSVNFSVVGIFYSTTVDISQSGNTVKNVMDYLYRTVPPFYYSSIVFDGEQIVNFIAYDQPQGFTGRTGITYDAGFYGLTQTFTSPTPNPYTVWQYYLFDGNGTAMPTQGAPSFADTTVQDGWSIVWRLVTILNGPGNLAKRLRKLDPQRVSKLTGTP